MFLKTYVELAKPFDQVRQVLLDDVDRWLPNLAQETGQEGERMLVDVGLAVGRRRLRRPAQLLVGSAQVSERLASLPIQLRMRRSDGLFPSFDGFLEAAWLGRERTQLVLEAQYEPPLGLMGRALDRGMLHRVAETAARGLLEAVAARIAAEAKPSPSPDQVGAHAPVGPCLQPTGGGDHEHDAGPF